MASSDPSIAPRPRDPRGIALEGVLIGLLALMVMGLVGVIVVSLIISVVANGQLIRARLTDYQRAGWLSERDVAGISRLSPSAFSRSFRRHTGMSLVQYVNRLRINLACQLLMGPRRPPVTEVCFAAGFNNLSNFNRQFLAQKGVTPSRFRTLMKTTTAQAAA